MTVALEGEGVPELAAAIASHRKFLEESGKLEEKTIQRMKAEVREILNQRVGRTAESALTSEGPGEELLRRMAAREVDPHTAAEEIAGYLFKNGPD